MGTWDTAGTISELSSSLGGGWSPSCGVSVHDLPLLVSCVAMILSLEFSIWELRST